MSDTLLDRGYANYNIAKDLYKIKNTDELYLNAIAYHIQQAVELTIKHILEVNGISYPWEHSIQMLLDLVDDNNIMLKESQWIRLNAERLTSWESSTRYTKGFLVEKKYVELALDKLSNFFIVYNPAISSMKG